MTGRTAVIADLHANLEALTAVIEQITAMDIDRIVCLGDVVGYNANPNECVDLLRNQKAICVAGNHDIAVAEGGNIDFFTNAARQAVVWTRRAITEETRRFLLALPREIQVGPLFLFHGSVHDTDRYIMTRRDAVDNFRMLAGLGSRVRVGLFGHTHQAAALVGEAGTVADVSSPAILGLLPENRYLINPGSVGQPRDGDPRAAFAILDQDAQRATFHRVAYDIRRCRDKILRAGLPTALADRLLIGR